VEDLSLVIIRILNIIQLQEEQLLSLDVYKDIMVAAQVVSLLQEILELAAAEPISASDKILFMLE
jgi:hypothetical protein